MHDKVRRRHGRPCQKRPVSTATSPLLRALFTDYPRTGMPMSKLYSCRLSWHYDACFAPLLGPQLMH